MGQDEFVNLAYLVAAVLFILGIKGLTHPRTAVRGNIMGATGMFIAVVVTLFREEIVGYEVMIAGFIVGALLGTTLAVRVPMTAMPQLVALFNGFGGGASAVVAGAALLEVQALDLDVSIQVPIAASLSGLIGSVTLLGSFVALSKLQGFPTEQPVILPFRHIINGALFAVAVFFAVMLIADPDIEWAYWGLMASACLLGLLLVIPIGGADMPVVISLLNSYSGLAAAATGFVLENDMLIIAGSLVGAAGFILTVIMCRAMNRSLPNVLFGGLGMEESASESQDDVYAGRIKSATPEEIATLLDGVKRVVIVPGYGLAVAQAQYAIRDLTQLLEARGVEVEFAIHPVAGRMPGHMNVLMAEADIAYDKLKEMDIINPTFRETDMAIVVGANDVVNPSARNADPSLPIAGMPILDVDQARIVVVLKRSLSPGFAGIPNPLFAADHTLMLFSDAKQGVTDIIAALHET